MPEITKSENTKSLEQIEQERLTRRQALRKLGFGAGLSAFMLLGVDDLARMVGSRMQQTARDGKVADQVAKELRSAGVAMAGSGGGTTPPEDLYATCQHCCNQDFNDHCYCAYMYGPDGSNPDPTIFQHCQHQASNNFDACYQAHCAGGPSCTMPEPPCSHFLEPPQGCGC